ncbi:hypothetical protein RclHR1_01460016 [Rhizophagus clarus]|uniref:Kinase-like domain-containing protein n=1 Tax=Rhizophagus clarus TaxID=94130 RepID=A0A2Z6R5K0_9GLOM|nr:hypothetical protein RclHR1_01460016 [Rhizophagus clarus]GET04731.1 kinase-like domain-containing protein [Rhizophagus clarus]
MFPNTYPLEKKSDLFEYIYFILSHMVFYFIFENKTETKDWIEYAIKKEYIKYHEYKYFSDIQEIGAGGFGKVYRVKWKNSEHYLALKVFKDPDNVSIREIVREFKSQRDVHHHNNIIRLHGITKSENQNNQMETYSLVMEYADGGNLRSYLKEHFDNLTWNEKLNMALQLACAILCLHDEGIVHRDLHSGNVLVHQNIIKLADFGLSRRIEETSKTHSGSFGVVPYIDPKKFNTKYTLDKMSDIYSLGVLLWEISSGQPPFKDESFDFLHVRISNGLREVPVSNTPDDYTKIYTDCWDGDPDNRPTIHEVVSRLRATITKENEIIRNHHLLSPNQQSNSPRNTKSTAISSDQVIKINFISENDVGGFQNAHIKIISQRSRSIKREIMRILHFLRVYAISALKKCTDLTSNMYRYIFWDRDVKQMVDKTVDFIIKLIDRGTERNLEKQQILDYLNNHNISSQVIYNWLLINQFDPNSIFLLGCFKYYGIETNKNYEESFNLFNNELVRNHILASYYIGHCYMFGYGVSKDERLAFEYYKTVANKGCVGGQNNVGYCYSHGKGTEKDLKMAIHWYEKAANNGNANAKRNLGVKYMDGEGVEEDHKKAFELFKQSAEGGNSKGIMMLGYCYDIGNGTNIDKQKAVELYQSAANLGNVMAQYNLAMIYENGEGIAKDINKAIYWYKKSSDQGHPDAQKKLENFMKSKEIKKELIYRISY